MLKELEKKIILILDKIFVGKYKKYSLFFTAFLDSIIAIIPTDIVVMYYFLKEKKASPFIQSIFVGVASFLGASILYFLSSYFLEYFPEILNSHYYLKIIEVVKYSFFIQFLFITFFAFSSIIPFTWLSILSGILGINYFMIFFPTVILGRFLRFFLIAFFTKKYGEEVLDFLRKNVKLSLIIIGLFVLSYLIYKFVN